MLPLLSIIVPVYNVEPFLLSCVRSILCQTFRNYEIILVDDGSKDKSGFLCDQVAESHAQVKVVHQENKGLSAARNVGLRLAKGEWVMFVDSDDELYDEHCLKGIMERTQNVDMVMCGHSNIGISGADVTEYPAKVNEVISAKKYARYLLDFSYGYLGYVWAKVYRRTLLEHNSIIFNESLNFCEDQHFVVQCLCVSQDIKICLDNTLSVYKYFIRKNSVMSSLKKGYNPKFFTDFEDYKQIAELLHERFHDPLIDNLALNNLCGSGYRILGMMAACKFTCPEQKEYILEELQKFEDKKQIEKKCHRSHINTLLCMMRDNLTNACKEEKVKVISQWMRSSECQFRYLSQRWKVVYIIYKVFGKRGLLLLGDRF